MSLAKITAQNKTRKIIFTSILALTLAGCGGGGGDNKDDNPKPSQPSAQDIAINKIKAFANGGSVAPTVKDYQAAGVTGVTSANLDKMNEIVAGLTAADVDTKAELEALTSQLKVNIAPSVNAGGNKTVQVNRSITIIGSASDKDGEVTSYTWTKDGAVIATTASFIYTPATVGTHKLTLTATDNDGGTASDSVSIIVKAAPQNGTNKAPTANAGEDQTVELGKPVTLNGSGTDADGTISSYQWTLGGTKIDNNASFSFTPTEAGTQTLTLTVTDNKGASASDSVTLTVTDPKVEDKTAPTIALTGAALIEVPKGTTFTDPGATAQDDVDGNITNKIVTSGAVNTNAAAGTVFTITYNVSDAAGNSATPVTRKVKIITLVDNIKPVIKLNGPSTVEVIKGGTYVEKVSASDNVDGNITNKIQTTGGPVNTNAVIGTVFNLSYNVSDNAGNAAAPVTRTVKIIEDTIAPVITLKGPSTVQVPQNATYTDQGATASDNHDGNITASIVKTVNNVEVSQVSINTSAAPGTKYTITYNVKDAAGNMADEVMREVTITQGVNQTIPAISQANKDEYLRLINAARAVGRNCGSTFYPAVAAVTWNNNLYKASYEHSQDMANTSFDRLQQNNTIDTFDHNGTGSVHDWTGFANNKRSTPGERASKHGGSVMSENIAAGYSTANQAMNGIPSQNDGGLIGSPGHCRNIMSASAKTVGMALFNKPGSKYNYYWTQMFGR